MEVSILKGINGGDNVKYLKSLHKLDKIDKNDILPLLRNPGNYNEKDVMILICDYSPVISGNIQIKYPNKNWELLKLKVR